MNNEMLLSEVEDLLRSLPEKRTLRHDLPENHSWFGRLSGVTAQMGMQYSVKLDFILNEWLGRDARVAVRAFPKIMILLHQIRTELILETSSPTSTLSDTGRVFDYFDEIRKIIALAVTDIMFVDPYLDAEFVSKYLPFVKSGVSIRLLSGEQKLKTLVPSVRSYVQQSGSSIKLRSNKFHDRFIFVDGASCYQSGSSFKDGAKKAPVTITQILDAFEPMLLAYEKLWNEGDSIL